MEFKRDAEAGAVYIYLSSNPYAYGKDLDDQRRIDYAADNTPVGVELISVAKGVNVEGFPQQDEIAKFLEANEIRTYTVERSMPRLEEYSASVVKYTWYAIPTITVVFGVELTAPVSQQATAIRYLQIEPWEVTEWLSR